MVYCFFQGKKPIINKALMEAIRKVSTMAFSESFLDEFDNMMANFMHLDL
jgi:hypothetical protein